ncbi:MAG: ABC transporter permease, partial [Paracoccaceae bacterium]
MLRELFIPRRIIMMAVAIGLLVLCGIYGRWEWLLVEKYQKLALTGIWNTLLLLVLTMAIGMLLAIPLGLAQAVGPWWLARPAQAFCGLIRGTP